MSGAGYVFGYGSLAEGARGAPAVLRGWRRGWGVAMDNARDIPGYKAYLRPDGTRPALHVCFLDVWPEPGVTVTGLCLPVDAAALAGLDARERNYERIRIDGAVGGPPAGIPVWTYRGSPAGRARLRAGRAAGTAVIAREYLDRVHAGFAALGPGPHAAARSSLDPGAIPVVELIRREIPE